jgi:hypothetical protein
MSAEALVASRDAVKRTLAVVTLVGIVLGVIVGLIV